MRGNPERVTIKKAGGFNPCLYVGSRLLQCGRLTGFGLWGCRITAAVFSFCREQGLSSPACVLVVLSGLWRHEGTLKG